MKKLFRYWDDIDNSMVYVDNKKLAYDGIYATDFFLRLIDVKLGIMQYSGLVDDDNNPIYEGDILLEDEHFSGDHLIKSRKVEVKFDTGVFYGENVEFVDILNKFTDIDSSGIKIIGNVYEK